MTQLLPFLQRQLHSGDEELMKRASQVLEALAPPVNLPQDTGATEQTDGNKANVNELTTDYTKKKDETVEDLILQQGMKELDKDVSGLGSPFGTLSGKAPDNAVDNQKTASLWSKLHRKLNKQASAFVADVRFNELPKDVQMEVKRFVQTQGNPLLTRYGMVYKELLSKVDQVNWKAAQEHIEDEISKHGINALRRGVNNKLQSKYILIVNDRIVDGHHFLAKVKALGITCSLNVLDLTPARFQKKSMWLQLKEQHARNTDSWKVAA